MSQEIEDLHVKNDNLEQHGRKDSIRIFGIPENTTGKTDDKVLSVINEMMGLTPPVALDDLEVTHRVGRTSQPALSDRSPVAPPSQDAEAQPATDHQIENQHSPPGETQVQIPKPILVKFASRRVKGRVMEEHNKLKDKISQDKFVHEFRIYIQDDLTKRCAYLAFLAGQLKRSDGISET